jgi:hypothetical protein
VECKYLSPSEKDYYPESSCSDDRDGLINPGSYYTFSLGMIVEEAGEWSIPLCKSLNSSSKDCPNPIKNDEKADGTFEVYTTTTIPLCSGCANLGYPNPDSACGLQDGVPKENQSSAAQQWYKFTCANSGSVDISNSNPGAWELCYVDDNPQNHPQTCPTTSNTCVYQIEDMAVSSDTLYYILVNNINGNPGQEGFQLTLKCSPGAPRCDIEDSKKRECCEGDITNDGRVDIRDIFIIAKAFGSKKGEPKYDPKADLKRDDTINIYDIFLIAKVFGCEWK